MYSVILTELGISIFNDGQVDKAFPFSNSVKEYLAIKNKESKPKISKLVIIEKIATWKKTIKNLIELNN